MKLFTYIFTIIAIGLIIYNATKINWDTPFEGQSIIGLITIFAALCGIILLQILRVSKKIETQSRKK
ncbi:hypothetical protein [Pontimicrobium sp. MEBiC01747]|jgi:hypothetical protein